MLLVRRGDRTARKRLPVRRRAAPAVVVVATVLLTLVPAHAQPQKAPVQVSVSVDTSGASTRLVLTHSRPVASVVLAGTGRLEVLYPVPIRVDPPEREIGDGILTDWRVEGERKLVLETGEGYRRYESFELRNPARLILDLQGTRAARGGTEGPAPAVLPHRRPVGTVVVLDPGHGGVETGAVGPTGLEEKTLSLDLARRVRRELQRAGSFTVVMTRDEDRMVPLDERTAVANYNQADLFVSIHLNASRRREAFGAETYYLSTDATDDEARTLAALENRSYRSAAAGSSDGNRSLELILWDLAQNEYLAESARLAESVQREMNVLTGTRDRGVRQAPFRVLMGATMPAILVETGFITNPAEEKRFRDPAYRDRVAEAIARAIEEFQKGLSRREAGRDAAPAAGTRRP